MPRFSLIVGTKDRTEEFARLLQSLAEQTMRDFELIVVDQNPDSRLCNLLDNWTAQVDAQSNEGRGGIRLLHLRSAQGVSGVSRARNMGIMHSSGEILAFPDDDCWYCKDTLQRVDEWFQQHMDYGILSIGSRDETGRVSGNRWLQSDCDLTRINVFRASVTYAYFIRRMAPPIPQQFDETLGPGSGTFFGAGDDTDFLFTLMSYGIRGRFFSAIYVGHPSKGYIDTQRAAKYGGGWGRVLAKNSLPLLALGFATFDFVRAVLRLILGNRKEASLLWAHGTGIVKGFFAK